MEHLNELSEAWQQEAHKIISKYQKEEGEQEYYMYYDVDVPKMMNELATAYKQAVHKLLSDRQQELLAGKINATDEAEAMQYDLLIVEIALFLNKLKSLTPISNEPTT